MTGEIKRAVKVSGRLREELSDLLRRMGDERLSGSIISRVEMTDDLQLARVYIRHQSGVASTEGRRRVLQAFSRASGRLRQQVTKSLGLRYSPNLRFFYDDAPDAALRVEALLDEIHSDDQSRAASEADQGEETD